MIDLSHIRPAVPVEAIKAELTQERFVRYTSKLNNEIYIVNVHNSPETVQEVGRLRELTFASADGGTGKPVDLDELDLSDNPYQQLIVWNPEEEEIVGGYRFIDGATVAGGKGNPQHDLSMGHYFQFSPQFLEDYLPYSIELGRSWVQPKYQPAVDPRKGMFALDNIWDGLGAIVLKYENMRHFYGKVTMYPSYDRNARNWVLNFLEHYFSDTEGLMHPILQAEFQKLPGLEQHFPINRLDFSTNFKKGLRNLGKLTSEFGESVPPLIKQYMVLSPEMKTFGTFVNADFGNVEETGILISVDKIYEEKRSRYITL